MTIFCEIAGEGPVTKADGMFYCPFEALQKDGVGWADGSFVKCHHLNECRAKRAVEANHDANKKNIDFKAHLPTTPITLAQRVPGAIVTATRHKK